MVSNCLILQICMVYIRNYLWNIKKILKTQKLQTPSLELRHIRLV